MRVWMPWLAAVVVLLALWPAVCMSSEGGPTSCRSLVLPLPWGESADTWGMVCALVAAFLTWLVLRLLLRRTGSSDRGLPSDRSR